MIANFFNKSKPVIIVNLLLLFAILYLIATFLFTQINVSIVSFGVILVGFIGFVFMLLAINFIINKNKLTGDNSYALLIIILLFGSFYETMFNVNLFFSNLLLFFAFRKIYSLKSGFNTKSKLFDAGFWIGISAILYSWSILFLILIYVAMFLYNKITLKNLAIPIIGFLFPIIGFFTYHFYFESLDVFYNKLILEYSFDYYSYNNLKYLIPLSVLITLILWSLVFLTPKVLLVNNSFKSAFQIIINHLIISIVIVLFSPHKNGSEMFFLLFPSGVIIANYLQKITSKIFKNVILYLFFIVTIAVYLL
ncbi:DUF6427 family protein [Lutibacter sp. A80]|uniref:DUF6427 family protein n=1 Tax=Lutibacter sp. A80 TaxID=2918453 RepID=UPI001F052776|nr:DUF6427 family protein [Lutibacter sp. A80]UMB59712.1 DUF6427 family protein [Lutibacter sp. A80]